MLVIAGDDLSQDFVGVYITRSAGPACCKILAKVNVYYPIYVYIMCILLLHYLSTQNNSSSA